MGRERTLESRVEVLDKFIKEKVAPGILAHGGYVRIKSLEENVLTLSLGGACVGCGVQAYTADSIANYILESFPDLEDVVVSE